MAGRKDNGLLGFILPFLIVHEIGKDFPLRQSHHIQDPTEPRKALGNHWLQEASDPAHSRGKCSCEVITAFSALRVEKKENGEKGWKYHLCFWLVFPFDERSLWFGHSCVCLGGMLLQFPIFWPAS